VMLGVFLIVGLVPGPAMLNEKLDLTFLMVWVTIAANIIAALFALVLQRWLVRVCYLPAAIIAPVILVFMVIGATMATRNFADLLIFGIFGFLGYVFKHTDWPRVPLLMGVVLGDLAERNFFIAHSRWGFEWIWQRPITVIIIVLTVVSVSLLARRRTKKKPAGRTYRPAETGR